VKSKDLKPGYHLIWFKGWKPGGFKRAMGLTLIQRVQPPASAGGDAVLRARGDGARILQLGLHKNTISSYGVRASLTSV
jgi:hypothetical protein